MKLKKVDVFVHFPIKVPKNAPDLDLEVNREQGPAQSQLPNFWHRNDGSSVANPRTTPWSSSLFIFLDTNLTSMMRLHKMQARLQLKRVDGEGSEKYQIRDRLEWYKDV